MDIKLVFGLLAGLFFLGANANYAKDVIQRRVVPQRTTWFIFFVLDFVSVFNQLASSAGYGIIPYIFADVSIMIIWLLSLRYGTGGYSTFDFVILFISLSGVLGWYVTSTYNISVVGLSGSVVSVIMSGLAILVAGVPTIRKVIEDPFSENYSLWGIAIVGLLLNIFALSNFTFDTLFIPICWMLIDSLVVISQLLLRPRLKNKAALKVDEFEII